MKSLAIVALLAGIAGAQSMRASEPSATASSAPEPSATHVIVTSEPGLEATAQQLAHSADDALAAIAADLPGLPQPPEIRVHVVRDAASLGTIEPARGAPPWAVGIAYPDLDEIGVALRRGPDVIDPETTLRHELGHVALGAAMGSARIPHWLQEGFAYQHSAEWSMERYETLAGMVWFGGVIPLADLDASFPAAESPAQRAYAESYDFVGYLARRGRWEDTDDDGDRWPFRRFLAEVGHGTDLDTAARHEFGKPIAQLFDEWESSLKQRYFTAPVGLLGLAVWVLCAVLLTIAWWRRRRQRRIRLAQWERSERDEDAAKVVAPPYVAWPGDDPFAEPSGDPPDTVN